MGKQWKQWQTLFSWAPKSLQMVTAAMKLKDACSLEEKLWQTSVQFSQSMVSDSSQPHGLQFVYDKPRQHIKKQRHYFADKGPSSQTYGFSSSHIWMWELDHKESWMLILQIPIVMYGCESWTIKKAECQRIDAFELWCWRRLLRVPWTARRSNQSILKEINPEYSLDGLMLKLKLQSFGHLMWRTDSLEKTLMLGKIEGKGEGGSKEWDD